MTTSDPTAADTRAALLEAAVGELTDGGRADISLRAVARRAGVSHAAPGYFFRDRAGLLTAVAAGGFRELAARLRATGSPGGSSAVAEYGGVYTGFALERPAVFDLMFGSRDLREDDDDLVAARADALGALDEATRAVTPGEDPDGAPATATLVRWAFAHGVAMLLRAGALQAALGAVDAEPADLARRLITEFGRETGATHPGGSVTV